MSATAHNLDPAATPPPDDEDHLKRNLSNRHIQLIALGGAIGTGLFMGSGKTIHIAGPSIMVVYVVLGTIMFFVLRAMGEILLHNLALHRRGCSWGLGPPALRRQRVM